MSQHVLLHFLGFLLWRSILLILSIDVQKSFKNIIVRRVDCIVKENYLEALFSNTGLSCVLTINIDFKYFTVIKINVEL